MHILFIKLSSNKKLVLTYSCISSLFSDKRLVFSGQPFLKQKLLKKYLFPFEKQSSKEE